MTATCKCGSTTFMYIKATWASPIKRVACTECQALYEVWNDDVLYENMFVLIPSIERLTRAELEKDDKWLNNLFPCADIRWPHHALDDWLET